MALGVMGVGGNRVPFDGVLAGREFAGELDHHRLVVAGREARVADRHGAVVIPRAAVGTLPEAAMTLFRREKVVLDACKSPDFKAADLRAIFARMDDIH